MEVTEIKKTISARPFIPLIKMEKWCLSLLNQLALLILLENPTNGINNEKRFNSSIRGDIK